MPESSLLLLSVQRALNAHGSLIQGGNNFQNFYSVSSMEVAVVEMNDMPEYIDVLVDEIKNNAGLCFEQFRQEITESLLDTKDFEGYAYGECSHLCCNSLYEKSTGKFNLFVYNMQPIHEEQDVQCELMSIALQFRLQDICVVLTHTKKRLFRKKKTWTEKKYLPAAVKAIDFVNALAMVISPLLQTNLPIATPTNLVQDLSEMAREAPTSLPSDDERRMIWDPVKQMNVVATDPEVLKMIPPRWITTSGECCGDQQQTVTNNWEFD